jgi:MoaA/NifB/PqqE/SkfB family radical SAM enzyme
MTAILKKLYRNLVLAVSAPRYQSQFMDAFYRAHLGHNKIIGFERGRAVYSLFFPALMGPQYQNASLRFLFGLMRNQRVPSLATIGVTDQCNATCAYCPLTRTKPQGEVLSGDALVRLIDACGELGCATVSLVGGEPLLRPDIVDVIRRCDKSKSVLLLFTNGTHLAEKVRDLRRAGLRRIMVSLDYPTAKQHDGVSGVPGMFESAIRGVRAARREGMLVGVSMALQSEATPEHLNEMITLCDTLGVHELLVNTTITCQKTLFTSLEDDSWLSLVNRCNADPKHHFGLFYYPYFASSEAFGCSAGGTRFYVSPYGDVTPCDFHGRVFGNVKNEALTKIWFKMSQTPGLGTVSPLGCRGVAGDQNA